MGSGSAIVIGAGVGGLTAAAALAKHFDAVTILESDTLPPNAQPRAGIPQGRHVHGLLAGGMLAIERLLPGFREALLAAGAVPVRAGLDARLEQPGFDPFPQRDFGIDTLSMSRPLLEQVIRQLVLTQDNISIRQSCRVREILPDESGASACGVRTENKVGKGEVLSSDLVIDASGRGATTLEFLTKFGYGTPPESAIEVDIRYSCGIFTLQQESSRDWKVLLTRPDVRVNGRRAIIFPIEGEGRVLVGLGGVAGDTAPIDLPGYLDYAKSLRTSTAYQALSSATLEGAITRFAFPKSTRRHFEAMPRFPLGLLPVADAICRINPSFGQGMSVAALEAGLLQTVLDSTIGQGESLDGLASIFFNRLDEVLNVPWGTAAQDYAYPHLEKVRPSDFEQRSKIQGALGRLAAQDPAIHKLTWEVSNLIKPASVYREPRIAELIAREAGG